MGGERQPWLNFIETLKTIEKSKEMIVKRPNKVMGPATGLDVSLDKEFPNVEFWKSSCSDPNRICLDGGLCSPTFHIFKA